MWCKAYNILIHHNDVLVCCCKHDWTSGYCTGRQPTCSPASTSPWTKFIFYFLYLKCLLCALKMCGLWSHLRLTMIKGYTKQIDLTWTLAAAANAFLPVPVCLCVLNPRTGAHLQTERFHYPCILFIFHKQWWNAHRMAQSSRGEKVSIEPCEGQDSIVARVFDFQPKRY